MELSPYLKVLNKSDLWFERSVGIKLRGVEQDPHEFSKKYSVLSESSAKGEAHGTKSTFKENQIHFVKLVEEDGYWGDELVDLISSFGGIYELKPIVESISPKQLLVVINKLKSDIEDGHSNDLSKESLQILCELNCDISCQFF